MRSPSLFFLLAFCGIAFSQKPNPDSLYDVFKNSKIDTVRVGVLTDLCDYFWRTGEADTAIYFAKEAVSLGEKCGFEKGQGDGYMNLGIIYHLKGDFSTSMKYYEKALKIFQSKGLKRQTGNVYNSIGLNYKTQGNIPEAIKNFYLARKHYEEVNNTLGIGTVYNSIGILNMLQYDRKSAHENFLKAAEIFKKLVQENPSDITNKKGLAGSYNNIALVQFQRSNYEEALEGYEAALKIKEEIKDRRGIAGSYNNIGGVYYELAVAEIPADKKRLNRALTNYSLALELNEKSKDKEGISVSCANLGKTLIYLGRTGEALALLRTSLDLANEMRSMDRKKEAYSMLAKADSVLGNYKSSLENYKLFIAYRDSLVNQENTKKTVQAEMTYNFQKKEEETKALQDKKDAVAAEERKKQAIIRNVFIAGFSFILVLAMVIFRGYRNKRKVNEIITRQKEEVENSKKLIERQKHLVEEKQKEILDSIYYARRIQSALITGETYIHRQLSRHNKKA